jgi:deoxyribonuclease-4
MRRLGVHTSIAGGLHLSLKRARELGCTTMQMFLHNPRGWRIRRIGDEEIEAFRRLAGEYDIRPIFIHSSYLINLASPSTDIRRRSIGLLSYEIRMASLLGVEYIVLHPGKAAGQGLGVAIRRASDALRMACESAGADDVGLLLENTAGQKGDISSSIRLIHDIIKNIPEGLVSGICLDSCHAFQAGYDITTDEGIERLKAEIRDYLSPLDVRLIHLNDSKMAYNLGVDRHQHIGRGAIGFRGLKRFLSSFRDIPLILETPVEHKGDDRRNLQRVRRILKEVYDGST